MFNDINTIFKLANTVKFLNTLKIAMTVGIIGFTLFRIVNLYKNDIMKLL